MCHGAKSNPDTTLDKTPIKQLTVPLADTFSSSLSFLPFPTHPPFPTIPTRSPILSPSRDLHWWLRRHLHHLSHPPSIGAGATSPFPPPAGTPPPTRLGRDGHGSLAATDLALGVATDMELGVTDLASPLLTHRHRLRRRFASFASSSRRSLPTKAV